MQRLPSLTWQVERPVSMLMPMEAAAPDTSANLATGQALLPRDSTRRQLSSSWQTERPMSGFTSMETGTTGSGSTLALPLPNWKAPISDVSLAGVTGNNNDRPGWSSMLPSEVRNRGNIESSIMKDHTPRFHGQAHRQHQDYLPSESGSSSTAAADQCGRSNITATPRPSTAPISFHDPENLNNLMPPKRDLPFAKARQQQEKRPRGESAVARTPMRPINSNGTSSPPARSSNARGQRGARSTRGRGAGRGRGRGRGAMMATRPVSNSNGMYSFPIRPQ